MDLSELKKQIQSLSDKDRKRLLSDLHIEHYEKGDYVSKVLTEKELKQFMTKFNGVSTKYLQNYMYWFMLTKKKVAANDKI